MDRENSIEVKNVRKSFKVYLDKGYTLKERVLFKNRRRFEKREVLKGISFEVKKGEAVGLIGRNGCGKSTTLKMLTGIMYPDSGSIEKNGRVSSLIELGAGFHPDLSGRENIYINASIFGLSKREIDQRLDEIIAFSELEEFIDNPVRTYSSGMYMRLAFAVAINVDADILLIDEILAVGDLAFQEKCFSKLEEIKKRGTTIVIVSHSLEQIEQICERSIWINDGVIADEGNPIEVHKAYRRSLSLEIDEGEEHTVVQPKEDTYIEERNEDTIENESTAPVLRWGDGRAKITDVHFEDSKGKVRDRFITGEDLIIKLDIDAYSKLDNAIIRIGIWNSLGMLLYSTHTSSDIYPPLNLSDGTHYSVDFKIDCNPFLNSGYQVEVSIESSDGMEELDHWLCAGFFSVESLNAEHGIVRIDHKWAIQSSERK